MNPLALLLLPSLLGLSITGDIAADDTTVQVLPLYKTVVEPIVLTLVGVLVPALLAYLASLLKSKTGIDLDADMRKRVQDAALNAAGSVLAKAEAPIGNLVIDVKHPLVKQGVDLLISKVPDAIAYLGLTPEKLAEIIQGKLGILQASAPAAPTK